MNNVSTNIVLFVALLGGLGVCLEVGRRLGRKAFGGASAHPAGLGTVEAVTFALLGLLLAFTFSGAAARLDTRRAQIVDEANAIGTAWLRIDLLPADDQPKVRDTLRRYTDSRIIVYRTFSASGLDTARDAFSRSTVLQQELWTQVVTACRDSPTAAFLVLPALNSMFDLASTRLAATQMHPPFVVYVVLAVIALVCAYLAGYEMGGTEVASRSHMLVLAVVLAFTFYVILDFEYPRLGLIRIDDFDTLLVQVRASMG